MCKPTVILGYFTLYGSSKEYAELLAAELPDVDVALYAGTDPEFTRALEADTTSVLIVISPNHGGNIAGAELLQAEAAAGRKVALGVVGMSLPSYTAAKDPAARTLGAAAAQVFRCYLPGRLNFSELNSSHRAMMWSLNKMLRLKPKRSANDENMLALNDRDTNLVAPEHLAPLVAWINNNATS